MIDMAEESKKTANKDSNIHSGHRQRMRERFITTGFEGFSQHQIVEMLLFYCCPRIDTNALAHTLINRFGSISGIFDASVNELADVPGLNINGAVLMKMIPQCMQIYYTSHTEKLCYDNTEKLKSLFTACYIGSANEEFRVACFDNDLRLISNTVIAKGSPSFTPVNVRKLTEAVLAAKSSYIAVSHNHPSGSPAPSTDDIFATRRIIGVMKAIGVSMLDHIIVGDNLTISMRESAAINIFE